MVSASAAAQAPDVRMTKAVADELRQLPRQQRTAVTSTIGRVGLDRGEPVDVPAPPGTEYLALTPTDRKAPIVVYRPMLPGEDGDWLVTSLVARAQYDTWRKALVDAVPGVAEAATGALFGAVLVALIRALTRAGSGSA
jgi:hypothetical protein